MFITSDPSVTNTTNYRRLLYRQLCGIKLANWELVGPHLGLSREQLDIIKRDRFNQTRHCVIDMFNKWLAIDTSFKSYEEGLKKVVKALYKVGENTIADELCGSKGKNIKLILC